MKLAMAFLTLAFVRPSMGSVAFDQIREVLCTGENGALFSADVPNQKLRAVHPEYPPLSNEYFPAPEEIGRVDWVPEKIIGLGGLSTDSQTNLSVLVTILFPYDQLEHLPSPSRYTVHFADLYGGVAQAEMECSLR